MLNNVVGVFSTPTPPVTNSYESIQTYTVGSGGQSTVTFSSIPSTYKHLQLRILGQTNRGTYGIDQMYMRFNGDGSGSTSYAYHNLIGNGSSAVTGSTGISGSIIPIGEGSFGTTTGGTFGGGVLDILDYNDTNKYKTTRSLTGVDINGTIAGYGGWVTLTSGLYMNTSAISSITIYPSVGSLITQYSSFALYGIKG